MGFRARSVFHTQIQEHGTRKLFLDLDWPIHLQFPLRRSSNAINSQHALAVKFELGASKVLAFQSVLLEAFH